MMSPTGKPELETIQKHKQEFLWQILVPVLVVALLLIVAAGFAAFTSSSQASTLADISIIWLIVPMLIVFLVVMAGTVAAIYGMIRLFPYIPYYSRRVHLYVVIAQQKTVVTGGKVVKPFINIHVYKAGFDAFFNSFRRK